MNLDQHIAQGTNLIFFIPTSIATIFVNVKNKNIQFKTAMLIIISGIIGAIIGAKISMKLNVNELRKYFGYFLALIAINEFYSLYKQYFKRIFKTYSKLNIKNKKANNKNI